MAAGTFTASALADVLATADNIWADNMVKPDFMAEIEVLNAIQAEQTARITMIDDPNKDYDVKAVWLKTCDQETDAGSDDCSVGGDELESDSKTYTIDQTRHYGFNVKEKLFRGNHFSMADAVAKGFLMADKLLAEYAAQYAIGIIDAACGTNEYFTAAKGTIHTDGHTYVTDTNDWDSTLIPHLLLSGKRNKFANPYLLSGTNLYTANWERMLEAANADGKGAAAKFNAIRKYFDVFNIDEVNAPDLVTYMINRGAFAFVTKNYHQASPVEYIGAGQTRFSVASRNMPGARIDVVYTNACSSNEILHKYSCYLHYKMLHNPVGCTDTRTGALKFVNGAVPEA